MAMENRNSTQINVPYPETSDLHLIISAGACRLKIKPGDGDVLVGGTYSDPSGALPQRVFQEGGVVRVTHEPNWPSMFGLFSNVPVFDLLLGKAKPYMLTIESGASENIFDLGALPLSRLQIRQGAGKLDVDVSAPNPQEMSLFTLTAGAGGLDLRNLANLNFSEMVVEGGAASYRLDFGGTLRRNAHARITTGVSSVDITVPSATAVKISSDSALGSFDIGDGFTKREGAFWNKAAVDGGAPVLTIHASVTLGSLKIREL